MKKNIEQIVEKYIKEDITGPFVAFNATTPNANGLRLALDYAKAPAGQTENDKARAMGYEITPDGLWKRITTEVIDDVQECTCGHNHKK